MSVDNSRLLTVQNVSREFGVAPGLVYHWVRYRKFPIVKIGKKVLIPRIDFEAFLDAHRLPGDSEVG